MSITQSNPNIILLGGRAERVNTLACSETITPGQLLERFNSSGTIRLRKHATAGGGGPKLIALDHSMANKGVDDTYAANDLVEAAVCDSGAVIWGLIASGQNIAAGDKMESAGNGTLRIYGSGQILFTAMENKPSVIVTTRIRVEAV